MAEIRVLVILCFIMTPHHFAEGRVRFNAHDPSHGECKLFEESDSRRKSQIVCENIGADGRSLDEVLRSTPEINAQVGALVGLLYVYAAGDVLVKQNGLSLLPNLEQFEIESADKTNRLDLVPREFQNTPRLRQLRVERLSFSNNSLRAMDDLNSRLDSLEIISCSPGAELLRQVAKCSNLTHRLHLDDLCGDQGPFPPDTVNSSAGKLRSMTVVSCDLPVMSKEMFKDMRNLWQLTWKASNISEVEPGAFDQLVKLEIINLRENQLKRLPEGLFGKNANLKMVNLAQNGIENLSRDNFTHCVNFEKLEI